MITSHLTRAALALSLLLSLNHSLSAASYNHHFARVGRCIWQTGKIAAGCATLWVARNCMLRLIANEHDEQAELMNYPLMASLPTTAAICIKSGIQGLLKELKSKPHDTLPNAQ